MAFLTQAANRGSISTGYDIDNSLKFEEDNVEAVYAQPTAAGNRRTWTVSMWFKRTEITTSGHYHTLITALVGSETGSVYITPTDEIICDVGYGSTRNRQQTTRKFRDTSAWYHIVWRVDTTQSTAANRHRLYVNGVEETWTTIDGLPDQNFDSFWNNNIPIYIGCYSTYNNYGMCGYIAEVHHTDGISHAPTEFGEFDEDSGIWKPKAYSGSYGNQGFYLPFDESSNLGKNGKGNDVDFTLQNITSADQATDTPTNNFSILNPLFKYPPSQVISEGNTEVTRTSGTGINKTFLVTMPVYSGKWYAEFEPAASSNYVVGIMPDSTAASVAMDANYLGNSAYAESISYYSATGQKIVAPSGGSTYGDSWTTGDTIGIGLDMDNNYVYFSKNGTWQNSGDPTSGATGTGGIPLTNTTDGHLIGFTYDTGGNMYCNFGGYTVSSLASAASDANGYGTFEYAPPSGYYALCTKNLAEYG